MARLRLYSYSILYLSFSLSTLIHWWSSLILLLKAGTIKMDTITSFFLSFRTLFLIRKICIWKKAPLEKIILTKDSSVLYILYQWNTEKTHLIYLRQFDNITHAGYKRKTSSLDENLKAKVFLGTFGSFCMECWMFPTVRSEKCPFQTHHCQDLSAYPGCCLHLVSVCVWNHTYS